MELLKKMLELYSPSRQEQELARFLVQEMRYRGFEAFIDEVGNAVGHIGQGSKQILLVGHMDTVPGEIPVRIEDRKLYGRGAVDAKGSLAAFIEATAESKNSRQLKITVIGCVEEEADSKGAKYLLNKYKPDYVIVGEPSGWDAITIGYKGSISITYSLREPLRHRGHFEKTPAEKAVEFYLALKEKYCSHERAEAFDAVDVNLISIDTASDAFSELAAMELNLRTPLGFDFKELEALISRIKGAAIVSKSEKTEAFKAEKNNELVRSFLKAIRSLKGKPKFKVKTGTSDMNLLGRAWKVPIVAYGPGDSSLDHTPHEHLDLREYERTRSILIRVLRDLDVGVRDRLGFKKDHESE